MRYPTRLSLSLTLLSWVAAVRSQDCKLKVPKNPLTAQGLATPYELIGCNQLDFANQGAFVEAAILDPATGNIQIYSPLVINTGMQPVGQGQNNTGANPASPAAAASTPGFFIPPVPPTLPNNAVVGIWFGSNGNTLTLVGNTGGCVNGVQNSVFGQFAYCNAQAWFNAAKTAVSQGLIKIPAPGTGSNGQACPTTHDFRVVDQDQSDNLVTTYLMIGGNTLAQNTPANSQANPNADVLSNASDNALITQFIDPSLGCTTYQNPCPTCPTGQGSALATDELQAFFFPPAGGPALVPLNDPMTLVNGQQSLQKVNLYRDGTGQPQADNNNASALTYCQQFAQSGIFINDNQQAFTNAPSPAADMANNLFTFLAMRFSAAFGADNLGCTQLLNVANPVTLTMDGNGVVTAATINTQALQQILGMVTGGTTASASAATSAPSTSAAATATASPTTTAAGSSTTAPATTSAAATTSSASVSAAATTSAAAGTTSSASAAATSAAATSASASSPSSSVASATSSAAPTSAPATTSASPTGVLLENTGTTSAVPTSSVPASVAPTVTPTATPCASATASSPATVTVTVTATVCPSQTSASATPSASATASTGGWNDNCDGNYNNGGWRGYNRKRALPMARMHRKSRMSSFE